MITLGTLRRRLATDLAAIAGADAPAEARLMLAHAAGVEPGGLLAIEDRAAEADLLTRIEAMTQARLQRKPLAHVLGRWGFWDLDLEVNEAVLVPRADTETLVLVGLQWITPATAPRVLDLGTGSGAVLLALLRERPDAIGLGLDLSAAALEVARRNARRNGLADRAMFACADWAQAAAIGFDLVLANPPYIPTGMIDALAPEVAQGDPRIALDGGWDGLGPYRIIAGQAAGILVPGGGLAVEIGADQAEDVADLFEATGAFDAPRLARDMEGRPRVVFASRR